MVVFLSYEAINFSVIESVVFDVQLPHRLIIRCRASSVRFLPAATSYGALRYNEENREPTVHSNAARLPTSTKTAQSMTECGLIHWPNRFLIDDMLNYLGRL